VIPDVVNVVSAVPAGEYRLSVCFDDGTERLVDFGAFLRESRHPAIRAWLDPARFADFRIQDGELIWGDYELCFPIADLYLNRIDHRLAAEAAD
jgi:hypothetical protein